MSRSQQSIMMKFKAGILPIRYKTGRYKGLGPEKRIWEICDTKAIENEMHFLFICPTLKFVRCRHETARRVKDQVERGDDMYEITKMLLDTDLKKLAAWIEDTWVERKNILYT